MTDVCSKRCEQETHRNRFCITHCGHQHYLVQCNASWGNNPMGTNGPGERSTICGEGCAMSSLSMALAGLGATIDGWSLGVVSCAWRCFRIACTCCIACDC